MVPMTTVWRTLQRLLIYFFRCILPPRVRMYRATAAYVHFSNKNQPVSENASSMQIPQNGVTCALG